jgi:hypothetical protein
MGAAGVAVNAVGPAAHAAVSDTVINTNDTGTGSLRAAIVDANANGGGTITFDAGVTGVIPLGTDLPQIEESVTIVGPASGGVTIDAQTHQAFYVTNSSALTISNLTVTGSEFAGLTAHDGGSIIADHLHVSGNNNLDSRGGGFSCYDDETGTGTLTISNSVVSGNHADDGGGGFYSGYCDVTVVSSTISDNIVNAGHDGGGLYQNGGTLTIENTTISGNFADDNSGGVYIDDGTVAVISNSTIADNTTSNTDDPAVGISVGGGATLDLIQSTVTGNHHVGAAGEESFYGALYLQGGSSVDKAGTANDESKHAKAAAAGRVHTAEAGTVHVVGTIISGNAGFDVFSGDNPAVLNTDHSVLGTIESSVTVSDVGGTQVGVVDAKLGPLADNGGPTKTVALLLGSPAVDAGPVPVPTFPLNDNDQRGTGFPRVVNSKVDVGAFEVQLSAPVDIAPKFTG